MPLPNHCTFHDKGKQCAIPPSFVLSLKNSDGEFMISAVCDDHLEDMKIFVNSLQKNNAFPLGLLMIQPVKIIGTNCIKGTKEDLIEIELDRYKPE